MEKRKIDFNNMLETIERDAASNKGAFFKISLDEFNNAIEKTGTTVGVACKKIADDIRTKLSDDWGVYTSAIFDDLHIAVLNQKYEEANMIGFPFGDVYGCLWMNGCLIIGYINCLHMFATMEECHSDNLPVYIMSEFVNEWRGDEIDFRNTVLALYEGVEEEEICEKCREFLDAKVVKVGNHINRIAKEKLAEVA